MRAEFRRDRVFAEDRHYCRLDERRGLIRLAPCAPNSHCELFH
jgi:hypothetical protein